MDTNTLILVAILVTGGLSFYGIRSFNAVKLRDTDRKIAQAKRMSQVRQGQKNTAQMPQAGVPAWIETLAEQFGVEDYLESDDMPPELEKLLPLVKGFIDSGGLQRILSDGEKQGPGAGASGDQSQWF